MYLDEKTPHKEVYPLGSGVGQRDSAMSNNNKPLNRTKIGQKYLVEIGISATS
jgi:multidrug resistance efflux pump